MKKTLVHKVKTLLLLKALNIRNIWQHFSKKKVKKKLSQTCLYFNIVMVRFYYQYNEIKNLIQVATCPTRKKL